MKNLNETIKNQESKGLSFIEVIKSKNIAIFFDEINKKQVNIKYK